jgi:uncharacterized protein DUF3443
MMPRSNAFRIALLTSAAVIVASCGGGGSNSSSPAPAPAAANVVPLVVDGGPVVNGSSLNTLNQAYVTITVCVPGTSTCQNIDHVWVDTGSTGLRLVSSALTLSLANQTQSGNPVGNCVQFVSMSYMWGAMRTADVKIGGLTASSMPIQVIGDSSVPTTAPSDCSNGGTAMASVQDLGANGLLGVGLFFQDCGSGCASQTPPPQHFYYVCSGGSSGTCQNANVATALQNQNVAGLFPTDNNGLLIQLPSLASGQAPSATGSLIFGIGTRTNNALGSAAVFVTDPQGFIQTSTSYAPMSEPASYVDSGTNFWQFDDSSITQCSQSSNWLGFYCPTSALSLSATMLPYNSPTNTAAFTYNFSIGDASASTGNAVSYIGGPSSIGPPPETPCNNTSIPCTFAWGLPFFYGRSVYVGFEGMTISGNLGPFFAASTP